MGSSGSINVALSLDGSQLEEQEQERSYILYESDGCAEDTRSSNQQPLAVIGQLNLSIADMENALDRVSEEQHLKDIWRELGVGKNGALAINELASVCQHIGMDEMNEEELQHLFDKLDVDEDGQVSFQEFLQGLFQHGGPTPTPSSATPVRHVTTPRQKLRLSYSPEDGAHTPSFLSISSGLFSSLNADGSGYATSEGIIELWESLGVQDGPAILEYLQFDQSTKVSLGDLSNALEQEIRTVEEDNATYQAATATFQHELRFLKTSTEHVTAERDKLQTDLSEAMNRILILIKEGDDRVSALEQKKEKDIMQLESRYQEQVKALQSQLEYEQTDSQNKSARQRHKMELEITKLKEEETKLKENLNRTQKELEKLEHEILEMAEKCIELEKQNERQQRELSSAKELQRKLEELESNRDAFQNEQQKFTQQRLEQFEVENKDLKDKNDELTMEVEALKQQLSTTRKRGRTNAPSELDLLPNRTGSILSDYAKPTIIKRRGDYDDSDDDTSRSQQGDGDGALDSERLEVELTELQKVKVAIEEDYKAKISSYQKEKTDLQAENDDLHSRFEVEIEELMREKEESEEALKSEMRTLKEGFETERKEIEQAFKLEITELEENHRFEREELQDEHQQEKDELQESLTKQHEGELNAQIAHQRTELERIFEAQKREILIKLESEKNLITQTFAEEKSDLIKRMRDEFAEELEHKLETHHKAYEEKIESLVEEKRECEAKLQGLENGTSNDDFESQVAAMKLELKLQKEEMELSFAKERTQLYAQFENERTEMVERHQLDIMKHQAIFSKGTDCLKGKLKDEFDQLVEEEVKMVRRNLQTEFEEKRQDEIRLLKKNQEEEIMELNERFTTERQEWEMEHKARLLEFDASLEQEQQARAAETNEVRQKLLKQYRRQVLDLEARLEEANLKHRNECSNLEKRYQTMDETHLKTQKLLEDRLKLQTDRGEEELRTSREQLRKAIHSEIEQTMQAAMEEEFLDQMEQLRAAFDDEREQMQVQVAMLQKEVQDLHQSHDHSLSSQQRADSQMRQLDEKHRKQLDELKKSNATLKQEKQRYKQMYEDANKNREDAERAAQRYRREKNDSISQVQRQQSIALHNAIPPANNNNDRDRVILDAIASQRALLENKATELKQQIQNITAGTQHANSLQSKHEDVLSQKAVLEGVLEQMQGKMQSMLDKTLAADQYKIKLDNWEIERDLLKEQLQAAEEKLADSSSKLVLEQSKHHRDMEMLKQRAAAMVDINKYHELGSQVAETERKFHEMELAMEKSTNETNKMLIGTHEDHQRALLKLQSEKLELERQLTRTQTLLEEHIRKLKEQFKRSAKMDRLVKDLYVENAQLMRSLCETERRQKDAHGRVYKLEEKCSALQALVSDITIAALA